MENCPLKITQKGVEIFYSLGKPDVDGGVEMRIPGGCKARLLVNGSLSFLFSDRINQTSQKSIALARKMDRI